MHKDFWTKANHVFCGRIQRRNTWQNFNPSSFSCCPLSKDFATAWGWREYRPYRVVLFEFPYSLTQAFVCPPQSVCSLLASSILYSRFFRNRAAMQKEVFYSIFCKGKTPKPHIKHMENSSKVWQWTYKWLVSLCEWTVQRWSSVWRDEGLMKLLLKLLLKVPVTYSTAYIKEKWKKGRIFCISLLHPLMKIGLLFKYRR